MRRILSLTEEYEEAASVPLSSKRNGEWGGVLEPEAPSGDPSASVEERKKKSGFRNMESMRKTSTEILQ